MSNFVVKVWRSHLQGVAGPPEPPCCDISCSTGKGWSGLLQRPHLSGVDATELSPPGRLPARLLRLMVGRAFDAVMVTSAQLDEPGPVILYANDAFYRMTGYTRREVIGQTPRMLQGVATDRQVLRRMRTELAKGGHFQGEIVNYRKDGSPYRVLWQVWPLTGSGGVTHWVSVQRDVTTERQQTQSLRWSEAHLRLVAEELPTVMWTTDRRLRVTSLSTSASMALRNLLPPHAHLGQSITECMRGPDGEHPVLAAHHRALAGAIGRCEALIKGRMFQVRVEAVRDDRGVVQGTIGLALDLTDHHAAERRLREHEAFHRVVSENLNEMVMLHTPDGRILYVTASCTRVLGAQPEALVGRSLADFLSPSDRTVLTRALARAIDGHEVRVTVEMSTQEGSATWMEVAVSAVRDSDGQVIQLRSVSRDVTDRMALVEELAFETHHDPLTHLPNSTLFRDRLVEALERSSVTRRPVAVLRVNVDGFKLINDNLGHENGNRTLEALADRLRRCVRAGDTVARLSGDEFGILVEQAAGPRPVDLANRISQALEVPVQVGTHELYLTVSIGIAMDAGEGGDADELVRNADIAMYRAKESGRAGFRVFDPGMNAPTAGNLILAADLRRALPRGELVTHLQPMVSLRTGRVEGFEALIRWHHPERGLLPPVDFIPLAEHTGLILPMGWLVLRDACTTIQEVQRRCPDTQPLAVSVNLSARQFRQDDLVDQVERVLEETGLEPGQLQLEITESTVMDDVESTLTALRRLKALGVCLAVDDFGTGYSSLSYLRSFPVDTLKIDRTFVRDVGRADGDAIIIRSIVALAKALNLSITAEGVEGSVQLDMLRTLGCDHGQGFFFARPMPADDCVRLLSDAPIW